MLQERQEKDNFAKIYKITAHLRWHFQLGQMYLKGNVTALKSKCSKASFRFALIEDVGHSFKSQRKSLLKKNNIK